MDQSDKCNDTIVSKKYYVEVADHKMVLTATSVTNACICLLDRIFFRIQDTEPNMGILMMVSEAGFDHDLKYSENIELRNQQLMVLSSGICKEMLKRDYPESHKEVIKEYIQQLELVEKEILGK